MPWRVRRVRPIRCRARIIPCVARGLRRARGRRRSLFFVSFADFIVPCVVYALMLRRSDPDRVPLLSDVSAAPGTLAAETPFVRTEHYAIPWPCVAARARGHHARRPAAARAGATST